MGQPARLEKMTSVRERGCLAYRAQASEAFTDPSSIRSNNDHKNSLGSNKPRPSEASPKAPSGPPQAVHPQNLSLNQYSQ